MRLFLEHALFDVDGEQYCWADVVLAAILRGDWDAVEAEVRQGLACLAHAEATGAEVPRDAVDAAAREFRYEHELITAEEAEKWLERWSMTPGSWMAWVRRSVLRREWAAALSGVLARYPIAQSEIDDIILADAVCGGHLPRFARMLAERAATAHVHPPDTGTAAENGTSRDERLERAISSIARRSIPGLARPGLSTRVKELLALDDAFASFRVGVLTPAVVREQIASHRLEWTRLDCREVAFADVSPAREAALCVVDDGETLAGVAAAARVPVRDVGLYLDEVNGPLRDRLLGARPGEILGPVQLNGGFVLYEVLSKAVPSDLDPAIRRRAEEGALRRAVARQMARVRWLSPLCATV